MFVLIWKLISIKIFDLLSSHEWMFCSFLYSRDKEQFFTIGQWMWLKLLDTNGIRFFLQISLGLLVRKVCEHNFEKAVNRRQCPNLQGHCLHNLYLLFPQSAMQFHWKVKLQWWIFQSKGAVIRLHMSCDVPNSYIHILTDKVSACDELF